MRDLDGKTILVVEDNYVLACDLQRKLVAAGAEVRGPFARADAAIGALTGAEKPDAAVLDLNLGEGLSFAVAEACEHAGVPITFVTGYEVMPPRWRHVPKAAKPADEATLLRVLGDALGPASRRHVI